MIIYGTFLDQKHSIFFFENVVFDAEFKTIQAYVYEKNGVKRFDCFQKNG